jgi:hypothetical protein
MTATATSKIRVDTRGVKYLDCKCGTTTNWPPSKSAICCKGCGAQWHR